MAVLNGIKNFLQLINDNWTLIICIFGVLIALYRKVKSYIATSNDKKIAIAKEQISQSILKMITDAEVDYEDWASAGAIKRSQVIDLIYKEYPILEKVVNQDSLVYWIDEQIDNALPILRDILQKQTESIQKDDAPTE